MNAANWAAYDVRAMLVGPAYTPDPDHVYVNQAVGELTNGSYSRKSVTGRFGTVDTVHDLVSYSANNVTWLSLAGGEAVRHLLFFKQVTNDSDSLLLFCLQLTPFTSSGDNAVIRFNGGVTAGIVFELKSTADPIQGPPGPQGPPGDTGGVTLPLDVSDIDATGIPNGYIIRAVDGIATWGAVPTNMTITGFGINTSLVETGQTVNTPAFSASYASGPPTTAVLTNGANAESKDVHLTPTGFTSSQSYVKNTPNQSVSFTLTAQGVFGPVVVAGTSLTWGQKNFWGVSSSPANTEAFIEALASSQLSTGRNAGFTVNASGANKIYYVCPTRYGVPIFTVGGFVGGFILRAGNISVTNAQGFTETYDLYESVNAGLGSTNVTVS